MLEYCFIINRFCDWLQNSLILRLLDFLELFFYTHEISLSVCWSPLHNASLVITSVLFAYYLFQYFPAFPINSGILLISIASQLIHSS